MAEQHAGKGTTRRRLLAGALGAPILGGNVAWAGASLASDDEDDGWISARIEAIDSANSIRIVAVETDEQLTLQITAETDVNRDGPARIEEFWPGETVAVRVGERQETRVTALAVHAFYHAIDDIQIVARSGDLLRTSEMTVEIDGRTEVQQRYSGGRFLPGKPLSQLAAGDRVSVLGRYEPSKGTFVAHYVSAE